MNSILILKIYKDGYCSFDVCNRRKLVFVEYSWILFSVLGEFFFLKEYLWVKAIRKFFEEWGGKDRVFVG